MACAAGLLMIVGMSATSCAARAAAKLLGHKDDADQTHALKELATLYAQPKFIAPGPAFDAKKVMAGKSIYRIAGPESNPWYQQGFNGMKGAAEKVGWNANANGASTPLAPAWTMKANMRTKCYTTRWQDLLKVG